MVSKNKNLYILDGVKKLFDTIGLYKEREFDTMPFLHKKGKYWYIQLHQTKGQKTLRSLGKVRKEEAERLLSEWLLEWNQRAKRVIKPVYRTIVIDPPWPMEKILREVRPNQIKMDYETISIDEIKKFPLKRFMSRDGCHAYLWTTQKFLRVAFEVLAGWGVDYQCLMTWVKNVGFTPFSWMYSTEHVLFGTVKGLPLLRKGLRLDFEAKVREHSRKPDEFYDIVRRVSPDPRIDIFSCEKREGFSQYGLEADKYDR